MFKNEDSVPLFSNMLAHLGQSWHTSASKNWEVYMRVSGTHNKGIVHVLLVDKWPLIVQHYQLIVIK